MKGKGILLAVVLICTLNGCVKKPSTTQLNAKNDSSISERTKYKLVDDYRIGVDDIVQVNVWRNPDLSVQVPVRPDGKISVPLIGDVIAGGMTPEEVAADIKTKLSAFIRDPQVAVILNELRSHEFLSRIRITGAVKNPRSIPYRQGMTVLDAILEAGGPNEFASPNDAKLFRRGEQGAKNNIRSVKLNDIFIRGDMNTNYDLQPGDVITVPERYF